MLLYPKFRELLSNPLTHFPMFAFHNIDNIDNCDNANNANNAHNFDEKMICLSALQYGGVSEDQG